MRLEEALHPPEVPQRLLGQPALELGLQAHQLGERSACVVV
jgi:hypothetical protein